MSKISVKKINNKEVSAIDIVSSGPGPKILGEDLFQELYANIFLVGKKKSGKTSAIFKILKESVGPETKIILFVSTVFKDANWLHIIEHFKKVGISITPFESIYDERGNDRIKILTQNLAAEAKQQFEKSQAPPKQDIIPRSKWIAVDEQLEQESESEEEEEPEYIAPEWIVVFDDLSNELHAESIDFLLKRNRHFKMKTIISSQYWHDVMPSSRMQIDYLLLFPGIPAEKLKSIWKESDVSITYDHFAKLYCHATQKKYNFFYIDTRNDKFRHNFNQEYII